ncbi:hypothetical protein Pmani_013006 [Petrolisthes manimaculis]|uniref:Leucine-rich repeat-containing protein 14 n=1 Tax=Petrolisthes manimaculis TaxID=1843537 RepID=A0AAE1U9R3_9EUCA|nr:hypothetical protein Pmani_013006 [Petrolisthes manimaculis]
MIHVLIPPLPSQHNTHVREAGGEAAENRTLRKDDEARGDMKTGQDLQRLEYLCACKIMSNGDIAGRLLPMAPPTLLPPLLKAFLMAKFNEEPAGSRTVSLLPLGEVLLLWPAPCLNLLPHLPNLLPCSDTHFSLEGQEVRMNELLRTILNFLIHIYVKRLKMKGWRTRCEVSKLDLSGLLVSKLIGCSHLKLEEMVRVHYNPNAPPDYDKREVVVDVIIAEVDEVKKLRVVCELGRCHGAGLRVRLGRVRVSSIPSSILRPLIHSLHDTGIHTLELDMCSLEEEGVKSLLYLSQSLQGLSLANCSQVPDIKFLLQFPHLTHLDLTGIRLRGKVALLGNLTQGLEYLNLCGCFIKVNDLDALTTSRHVASLRQLDLSENDLGNDPESNALCRLFQAIQNICVLELEHCGIQRMSRYGIQELVATLGALRKLVVLKLLRNDLLSSTILVDLPALAKNPALRCICLTVPSWAYLSDNYTVNEQNIDSLQKDFNHSLISIRNPPPVVDWQEESTYSCWYYSVGRETVVLYNGEGVGGQLAP